MQEDVHIFQGLRRDNHQIRQKAEYLWDAHNIRLTNREDSTLLSITNEKGTLDTGVTFQGFYVGHCVLGKYLVVFTADDDSSDNYIYRVEKLGDGTYKTVILFHEGNVSEYGWNPNNPIEALGVYETELVQKVYWVDGVNQPKVINIASPELRGIVTTNGQDLTTELGYTHYSFNFIPTLTLNETVSITKRYSDGEFSPGTIQYAFTYYNKYLQESNIFYTTGLYYISPKDRGGNPEEKVNNSFKIVIDKPDKFDYVRVYSIHRSSIDAVPTVKVVADRAIDSDRLELVDTGTIGYTIDPTQLLYIGGRHLVPGTLTSKDNTLFMGNLSIGNNVIDIKSVIDLPSLAASDLVINTVPTGWKSGAYYEYTPKGIADSYFGGFKYGEKYRCGIQFQYDNGEWSEPLHIGDIVLNETHPSTIRNSVQLKSKQFVVPKSVLQKLYSRGVRRMRPCVVFPSSIDRDILCQGVLSPTVYNVKSRQTSSPYIQSSWFFRLTPENLANNPSSGLGGDVNVYMGAKVEWRHNRPLLTGANRGAEVQNMQASSVSTIADVTDVEKYSSYFFVDSNVVTFHSPDIEFGNVGNLENTELVIIGTADIGAVAGDIDIQTSSPTIKATSAGFNKTNIGYPMKEEDVINGGSGLVAGLFYDDAKVYNDFSDSSESMFMVYPWHRSGSLNNDSARPDGKGTRSAVLSKKKISNLKFSYRNTIETPMHYDISTPILFDSNEVSMAKVMIPYLGKEVPYYGNIDTIVTSKEAYDIYVSNSFSGNIIPVKESEGTVFIKESKDPVRIKYKSSPHLVFSLNNSDPSKITILPRRAGERDATNLNGETYTPPSWADPSPGDVPSGDIPLLGWISTGNPMLYPEDNYDMLGKFWFQVDDELVGNGDTNTLWECVTATASSSHKVDFMYSNNSNGTIFRIEKGQTVLKGATGVFASLPKDSNNVYTGETKYYKATKTGVSKGGIFRYSFAEYTFSRAGDDGVVSRGSSSSPYTISQQSFGSSLVIYPPYLLLAEIRRKTPVDSSIKFGGDTPEALRSNLWIPASEPTPIKPDTDVSVKFLWGDTWYGRYDCLKTYPFTQEDENSVIEIGSFMCETRVNIDGRYDRNRGQLSNLNMTPQNFNLLNEVYSQKDNFFNYRILDEDYYKQHKFANQVTWSKEKSAGEEIDTWTNITLANTLDMDGSKGGVTSLKVFNETLVCFQEKAISQILFNSRVQIPTSDGVPVEVSNGYKVDGSRFISGSVGCQNKWATTTTTTGVYFIDNYTNTIWLYNGQLNNISEALGMKWWVQNNHTDKEWRPLDQGTHIVNGVRAFYDPLYRDIYFTPGPDTEGERDALCYSEQLGQFTSQMSYGGTQAMFQFGDGFFSLRHKGSGLQLYENFKGNYNNFFGTTKGWDFSFISNDNPLYTKIFDTVELRADHWMTYGSTKLLNTFPMNYIEVENEYQKAKATVDSKNTKKKFRVWRAFIPRSSTVSERGTDITRQYGRARIRNPWAMIKMGWKPEGVLLRDNTKKAMIHDISVKYTI